MIETETHTETREHEVASVCDRCGLRVEITEWKEHQEFLHVQFTGGYGSILGDCCTYAIDLCQHCVAEVLGPHLRLVHDYLGELLDEGD